MKPKVKKWINRGGLAAVIVGFVAITVAGGDVGSATTIAASVATAVGAVLVAIREFLN